MSDDPLRPHSHDNNIEPPDHDPTIWVTPPGGKPRSISLDELRSTFSVTILPAYTYTTDHGQHGPYRLVGVSLRDLALHYSDTEDWSEVEVVSADGFGNRIDATEVFDETAAPILLCYESEGEPLSRQNGLIRLVVPSETDNALRQIKWVREIRLVSSTTAAHEALDST